MLDQIPPLQLSVLPSHPKTSQAKLGSQVKVQIISHHGKSTACRYAWVTLVQSLLKTGFFHSAL